MNNTFSSTRSSYCAYKMSPTKDNANLPSTSTTIINGEWESTFYQTPHLDRHLSFSNGRPAAVPFQLSLDPERRINRPIIVGQMACYDLPMTPAITPAAQKKWTPLGSPTVDGPEDTQDGGDSSLSSTAAEESPTSKLRRSIGKGREGLGFQFGLPAAQVSFGLAAALPVGEGFPFPSSGPQFDDISYHQAKPEPVFQMPEELSKVMRLPYPATSGRRKLRASGYRTIWTIVGMLGIVLFFRTVVMGGFERQKMRYDVSQIHGRSIVGSEARVASAKEKETSHWSWRPHVEEGEGGIHILAVDAETERETVNWADERESALLAEEDQYDYQLPEKVFMDDSSEETDGFSSMNALDDRVGSGRPGYRFKGMDEKEVATIKALEAQNRISSLRALTAFISSGQSLPGHWLEPNEDGATPLDSVLERAWKRPDGDGLEHELKQLLGSRLAKRVFKTNWKSNIDMNKRLVMYTKSYCPYSRQAKRILDRYTITPSTYFIDLAMREDGPVIQSLLEAFTSRRTVPNILLNWHPVGGADELTLADAEGSLVRKFAQGGLRLSSE